MRIITGWGPDGWGQYGERFARTFDQYWPEHGVDLHVWVEHLPRRAEWLPRGEYREAVMIRGFADLAARLKADQEASGRRPRPGWKEKDRQRGYCFRFDAAKFSKMALFSWASAESLGEGILVWLDADVVTHADIPTGWVDGLLGDAQVAYLGRERYHSEIGFVAYRLPEALPLLRAWAGHYLTGSFRNLREWHSAYVWDVARIEAERQGLRTRNLHDGSSPRHPWHGSPLARYTDHLKGPRKGLERSPESRR